MEAWHEDIQRLADLVSLVEILWAIGGAVIAVLGWIMFGPRYKQRIATLEARVNQPAIRNAFNFSAGQPLEAAGQETVQSLEETIRQLPQRPLGDGITLAELPPGTNIVSMPNGEFRLALPIQVELGETLRMHDSVETKLIKGGDP